MLSRVTLSRGLKVFLWALALLSLRVSSSAAPLPFLNPYFTDHMVIQRGKPVALWGYTGAGRQVTVSLGESVVSSTATSDGRWEISLTPPPAGGPYTLKVSGDQEVKLEDVLVGDVWLCSGQSNMEFALPAAEHGDEEVKQANHPNVRFCKIPTRVAYGAAALPPVAWKVCTPENAAAGLSAVGYFFARRIEATTHVPIGLVQAAVGGSPIESWMSPEGLREHHFFENELDLIDGFKHRGVTEYGNYLSHWFDDYDLGQKAPAWSDEKIDETAWRAAPVPGVFAAFGLDAVPSVIWIRRTIELSEEFKGRPAVLHLGQVEKMDTSWVNGVWIGASSWVENPRAYKIPAGVLKAGKNVITLRVFKLKSRESFLDGASSLHLQIEHGPDVPLHGDWLARVSVDARAPHPLPPRFENYPTMPQVLFQGMIRPLAPLSLAGVLWYQGEANFLHPKQYSALLPEMVAEWRSFFNAPGLPFYVVSLPAFMERKKSPGDDLWAELRHVQLEAQKRVPGLVTLVTCDTGEAGNIHPKDKKTVGERVAAAALSRTYNLATPFEAPSFTSLSVTGNLVRVQFSDTGSALVSRESSLSGFALAGADRVWHAATARLEGASVVVESPDVKEPVAVRYAWEANPALSLFSADGLPVAPFRSDDWPLSGD